MRFLPLVENEVLKLLKRRRFRVVLLILVALIGLIVYAQIKGRERFLGKENWRVRVQERIARMQNQVRSGRMPRTAERWTRFEIARLQYHVDRDVDPDAISGPLFVRLFANASSYLLLPLLALVFGSDIVSSEFSQGTIKLLLTRPVSRAAVLSSKLAALVLAITLMVLAGGVVAYAFGGAAFGYRGMGRSGPDGIPPLRRRLLRRLDGSFSRSLEGHAPRLRPGLVRGSHGRGAGAPDVGPAALDRRRDGDDVRGAHRRNDPAAGGAVVGGAEIPVRDESPAARLLLGFASADPRHHDRLRGDGSRGLGRRRESWRRSWCSCAATFSPSSQLSVFSSQFRWPKLTTASLITDH